MRRMSTDTGQPITSVADLEAAVGKRPSGWHLKSIALLDDHCAEFLSRSTFSVLGVQEPDGRHWSVPIGGEPGVVGVASRERARIGDAVALAEARERAGAAADNPDGIPAGLLALVPGYRETLRVNGRLIGDELVVEEVFLHCAKCMIRSGLWDGESSSPTTGDTVQGADLGHPEVADFLARSPWITVTSSDGHGHVDVSPKGDPAGFVQVVDQSTLAIPDRPGNKRTDTFHNLLDDPEVCLLGLVPGDDRVLRVRGRARVSEDADLRAAAEVKGNVPAVMMLIEGAEASLDVAPALDAASLWDPARHVGRDDLPRASRIWTDHVKLNDDPGLGAKVARSALPERLMRAGLASDYKNNLY